MVAVSPPPAVSRLEIRAVRRDQRLAAQRYAGWLFAGAFLMYGLLSLLSDALTSPLLGLIMAGVGVVCAAIALPVTLLLLRRRRLILDAHTLTSVPAVGRPRVFDRDSIKALRVTTGTMSARGFLGDMGGPLLLLLDGAGHCLRAIRADRFTEDDCRRVADYLGVPITGTYADCRSTADLNAQHPGTATRGQLRAGRWFRVAIWMLALAFALLLTGLVLTIVRRDTTPPYSYRVGASNAAPAVNLPGAGTYRGSYTMSDCTQAAAFRAEAISPASAGGGWNISVSPSGPLGATGGIAVSVSGSPGLVLFLLNPPGACQAWSLSLTWTSTIP